MQKIKKLLALILIATLTVTSLPLTALASGTGHTTGNMQGFSSAPSSFSSGNDLQTVADTVYNASKGMVLASTGEEGGSGFQYALSLKIELKELQSSLSVQADTYSLDSDASGGELVVTLYENENGIPKLIDLFTAEVPSGVLEVTPDIPEASGVLSFAGVDPEKLVVSAVICRSLDEPLPLSAAVSYDVNGFILVPASVSTLAATEVTKTSAVLHGQVAVAAGIELNAADFGFLVFNSLESEAEEETDEDGNPIGVILPDALPAASITSDGHFSLPLTNLETGQEYQYMAVSKGKVAAYGEPMGVTTKSDLPAVETDASPAIESENSIATIKGTITDTKGFVITESGMMFGTDPNSDPTQKLPNQSGLEGSITSHLGSLQPGKTYYYRAYAKNSAGTGYGKTYSFTMPAVPPTLKKWPSVTFDPITWKATFAAEIASSGGAEITERGFRYQYKNDTEWYYLPVKPLSDSNTFILELEGQRLLPIGYYKVEAYLTNSAGTVTMLPFDGGMFSTPYLSEVDAGLDNTSVTASSAVLKGEITAIDHQGCQERGFQYKAASDILWLEVGMEEGNFGMGEYTFTLEGLRPYTEYLFRAKAYTYAGWSYSPEISFTTVFSESPGETSYQMKMDGKSAVEIAALLKQNFNKNLQETADSLKFASFDAADIGEALKAAPYNAAYREAAAALKAAGFDATAVASALKTKYADVFAYEGGNLDQNVINVLMEQGYTVDETVKALRDYFGVNIVNIASRFPAALGVTTGTVYASLIRIYGPYAFARDYWNEYHGASNPGWYIEKLAGILKDNTAFGAGDIAAALKEVYPEITVPQFIANCRDLFPAIDDMGVAVIYALGADPVTAVSEMKKYPDKYPLQDIKKWLIDKRGFDAPKMVELMMGLTDPALTVPALLKEDFGITSARDAARVMYEAGWKEGTDSGYGYWRMLRLLKDNFDATSADLISIMKELGLSSLTAAQQMEALKTYQFIGSWTSDYKNQGYKASDLADWCKSTAAYAPVDQGVIVLGQAGYSLDEITAALKQAYKLDAAGALTILKYGTFINTYKWWTEAQATATVDLAYNTNTLETIITGMKNDGASPTRIANTLKESFAVTEPGDVADYLIQLGYGKDDVLQALAQSFRSLNNAELVKMLSGILRDKFYEESMDNMKLILSLYESVKGNLNHAVNGTILLYNSGLTLTQIAKVLKNDIDELQNVPAAFTAFEAGQLLLGLKSYGVAYDKLDVFSAVNEVYGVNFMQETVTDFKNNKKYDAATVTSKLGEDFGIDTPSAAAFCLKTAGYSMAEVLEGFVRRYASEKELFKFELLKKVMKDVYPEEQAPIKAVMEAMNARSSGLAAETLYRLGYAMTGIISVLKNDYELSSGEAIELLHDRKFDEIVVSVQDVFGGNGYLDFILYRKSQGDSITQLFDWLYQKLGVTDIAQIISTLKLAGFEVEDVITLLYSKREVSNDETILQVQDSFGEDSIQNYLNDRKSKGDNISEVVAWLVKFGVKEIKDITAYLYAAGYTSNELIEFLFGYARQERIVLDSENLLGESTIAAYLKDKKAEGATIGQIYILLSSQFAITNITQVSNYLKAVGYAGFEVMDHLLSVYYAEPERNAEIVAAVQAASSGDAIAEFLRGRKSKGEGLLQLYGWLSDKFSITDLTQTVAYLKALSYSGNEIMEFLFQQITGRNAEIVAAVQAANAANGTDAILEFLREKKNHGGTILMLYSWLEDKFNITDIEQTVSYFKAVGYTNNEIITFWNERFGGDPSQYEEIIQVIQAASGTDVVLDLLREKKTQGDGLYLLYGWLKDNFGITDLNIIASYFLALDYNSSQIIEFLYQKINDPGCYQEIIAAVQAAQASSGADAILEFLKYKKDSGIGLDNLYIALKDSFGITDLNITASYFLALGYNGSQIIEFLYQKINDPGRYQEIVAAVQAAQASSGADAILEFLKYKKDSGIGLDMLYIALKDNFGITDLNITASYFLALGYNSSQIIEFLYQKINDPGRYQEIVAAVQAAQASSGADAILEYLKYKKDSGIGLDMLYIALKDNFGISDMDKILHYFKQIGFSSMEVIEFAYSRQLNEQLISSVRSEYSDSSIMELLTFRKSQGDSLLKLYNLLAQLGITETGQVTAWFQRAGFSADQVAAFLNERGISRHNQLISLIQDIYGGDAVEDFFKSKKNEGDSAGVCIIWLTDKFGITDTASVALYLKKAGFTDSDIIEAIDRSGNGRRGFATLKALYSTETAKQLAARLLATPASNYYSFHSLVCGLKQEFPALAYSEIVLMLRDAGQELRTIMDWLMLVGDEESKSSYLGLTKDEKNDLASILGREDPDDLNLEGRYAGYILRDLGFDLEEATKWAIKGKFSNYDVFVILKSYGIGMKTLDYRKELLAMENAGFSLAELAEALIANFREGTDNESWNPYLHENPYSTSMNTMRQLAGMGKPFPEIVTAMIKAGISPRYMINSLYGYWYDRYYCKDPMPNHYPHTSEEFSPLNIVTWVYNAVQELPKERRESMDIVEETANGLYTIIKYGAQYSKIFEAMMFIAKNASSGWNLRLPEADVIAIGDMIKTINSLISFGQSSVDNVLHRVLVVSAMRTVGFDNDEATALLKSVVGGKDFLMNFAMQAMGGYNLQDSWKAVMRVESYRFEVGTKILWTIASSAYKLDAYYKVLKDLKTNYDRLKKVVMFLVDHGVLGAAPANIDLASYGGLPETMSLGLTTTAEISDVTLVSGENSTVTVRGTVSSGANTELLLLMKKPDVSGNSQKDTQLASLTDEELKGIIDYFGCVSSTEPVQSDGASHNFELRYRSGGTPGEYAVLVGTAGAIEAYAAEGTLFAKTLAGNVSITGMAKIGETLTADISGLINAVGTLTYQWYRADIPIDGANSNTYTLVTGDIDKTITVKVTADGIYATGSVISAASEEVTGAYTISIGVITGGAITASPTTATEGETITLTITPDTGKRLKTGSLKYNDGTKDHAISGTSFTMPAANVTVTAEFESIPPTIYMVSIGAITGGTITASPTTAAFGETITLTITPDTGRRLKAGSLKYNDGTEDHAISGTSFTMPAANVTVTAEFELIPPTTYTVSIGTITGGTITASPTTATFGETITLTITPDTGKRLKAGSLKYNDSTEDHAISGTSFTMSAANVTVTAEFEAIPPGSHTVSVSASPEEGGTVSGGGIYTEGASVEVTATPNLGYTFIKWTDNESISVTKAVYGFTMGTWDIHLIAEFEAIIYAVSTDSTITGGTIAASPTMATYGETITLTITPDEGMRLKAGSLKYNDGTEDHIISGTSFTMAVANVTVTAEFESIPPTTYTVSIETLFGGTIIASPTVTAAGETITLTITPDTGKRLKAGSLKYNDGAEDHAISGTSFTMPAANVTVTAEFEDIPPTTYTISIDGAVTGGTINASPTTAVAGETITLTITPDTGKRLKAESLKYNDGTEDYAISETSFTMPSANVTVIAEFESIPPTIYMVSIGAITGGTITASPTTAAAGETITLTITPDAGKRLKAGSLKYNDGTEDRAISGTSFTMPSANVTVTAEFELIPPITYTVSIGAITGGTITASPTTATSGETITLTITPDTGKRLKAGSLKYNDGTEDRAISGTSFTMPSANVTVAAEFEDVSTPVTDYDKVMADIAALSIGYAPEDSAAAVTQNVSLTVTGAVYGSIITWTSSNTAVISDSGVVTRPGFASGDATVTVTATVYNNGASSTKDFDLVVLKLPQITYTVTFDKNGGDTEASPATKEVISGGNVGMLPTAPTRSGYTFIGWNTQANGSGTAFTAATAVTDSITVYAQWSRNSSGGGGGSSGGSGGTSTPVETPKTETNVEGNTATATTTVTATVDSIGNAAATVSRAQVSDAISKALEEAEKQGEGTVARVEIKVEASADATTAETIIPKEAVSQASEAGIGALTISTPVASITFDANTLSALSEEAIGDMKITASKVEASSLSPEAQRNVGDRPVFDFSVTSGGKNISQFGGDVSVSVPYTPKEGEDTNAIVIYYINDSGELEVVSNCIYDSATGRISFSTRHFSQYAVGYNKVHFKDVAESAWYSKAIGFIAAREITTGTGGGNFSLEAKLTRGQFIVMLMKAYGIAPDADPKDNFADAGATYYTGYLAAAKRLSISGGVGNNMFAPDKEITRQEMFTLLYNALKVIRRLPEGTAGKPLSSFADAENVASWAKEAMTLLVESGTISGNGGKLSPTNTTTRAEMAQVLYNLLSK